MSVFKMGVLTLLIVIGAVGYAFCNWPSEKIRLNDYKEQQNDVRLEQCRYCGCISLYGTGCLDSNCPGSK